MATGKLAGVTRIEMLHHHFPRSPVRCSTWRPTATATFHWKQNPRQWQWRWNVHDKSVGQPQTLLAHRSARIEWCLPGRYRFSKRKSGIIGYTTHANSDLLWTSGLIHTPWLFHLKLPSTANEPGSCDLHIWRWRSQLSQAKRRRLHDFRVFARHFSVAIPCLIRLQFFTLRIEQATHTWRERQKIGRVKIQGKK